jgi:hypothetical protein
MSNGTFSDQNSQDLASIPTAQGGLSRLVIARSKAPGAPVAPLLRRAGLIAEPEERLSVRGQIALPRDFDLRKFGLLYYLCVAARLFKR